MARGMKDLGPERMLLVAVARRADVDDVVVVLHRLVGGDVRHATLIGPVNGLACWPRADRQLEWQGLESGRWFSCLVVLSSRMPTSYMIS